MKLDDFSFGNSIFKGLNDEQGLLICGYEYGYSKEDEKHQTDEMIANKPNVVFTFANKEPFLGKYFWSIPYDNRIATWFEIWGHALNREGLGGNFEKSMVQINWANTQNNNMEGNYDRLLELEQIDNFISQVEYLKPSVILFMGSKLIDFLNHDEVFPRFENIVGKAIGDKIVVQKDSEGAKFKVTFQDFENCKVVCFPHPSASRGLSLEYIAQFKPEMDKLLQEYKQKRGF